MKDIIKKYIEIEAKKHSERYHSYHNSLHIEHERNKKRFNKELYVSLFLLIIDGERMWLCAVFFFSKNRWSEWVVT